MKFSYYRLFVEYTEQISLLANSEMSKKDVLLKAFDHDEPIYVTNRAQQFVYKKIARKGDLILGKIAKKASVVVEHSAEENFVTEEIPAWPGVYIVINVSDDSHTGQSIAIEYDASIFHEPYTQLDKLTTMLNSVMLQNLNFEIRVNPITKVQDFWKIVDEYNGQIRSLTLKFAAPNLFGAKDEFNRDFKKAQEKYRITDAAFVLENTENNLRLPKGDEFLNESVGYVTDGGGIFRIKLGNRKVISSKDNIATKNLEDIEIEAKFNDNATAKDFSAKLFSWLKHRD